MTDTFETISISSKDRDLSSKSSSDFDYTVKDSISVSTEGLNSVKLTQVVIPFSFYVVQIGLNNQVPFNDGVNKTAVLAPGTYTHSQLCVEVAADLNLLSGLTWTCTYNSIQDRFEITSSGAATLTFGSNPSGLTALADVLLGYNADTASGTIHNGQASPEIEPSIIFLAIKFDEASEEILQSKQSRHTFTIPITSDFSKNIVYKPDIPMVIQKFNTNAVIKKVSCTVYRQGVETEALDLRGRNIDVEMRFEKS